MLPGRSPSPVSKVCASSLPQPVSSNACFLSATGNALFYACWESTWSHCSLRCSVARGFDFRIVYGSRGYSTSDAKGAGANREIVAIAASSNLSFTSVSRAIGWSDVAGGCRGSVSNRLRVGGGGTFVSRTIGYVAGPAGFGTIFGLFGARRHNIVYVCSGVAVRRRKAMFGS